MMRDPLNDEALRVAFFPDCYQEVDGVANTSRQYEAFAIRRGLPFLTVHGGDRNQIEGAGSARRMQLRRGPIAVAFDKKHDFDLTFLRHCDAVEKAVREFNPDVVHITGPNDVGILGTLIAHRLRLPLAASWHTNLHQYAQRRAENLLFWLPRRVAEFLGASIRDASLRASLRYYHIAEILFAPNQELIQLLERGTNKPCYLMQRGVDTVQFDPTRRDRSDSEFVIGYVGRLTVEKNVRLLADLERELVRAGIVNFRFLVVGQGAEEPWLRANLCRADLPGVLTGDALGRAYANMDAFVFPSRTDTYGNVVLEALASGVPAIVTDSGGPRFVIRPGENGFIATDLQGFVSRVRTLIQNPPLLAAMRIAARAQALSASWDAVFESVYAGYERGLRNGSVAGKKVRPRGPAGVCADAARMG
jgi:glycosyltransferase involved in cell wall biosynthesis